jgi:2,3-bisphosphoglycerate-dependent phosphoglycerate mutase
MKYLLLARHSNPIINPDEEPTNWSLSTIGKENARIIAAKIRNYQPEIIISSIEQKAIETAKIFANDMNIEHKVMNDLHEQRRSKIRYLSDEEFQNSIKKLFENPNQLVFGDESANQAKERFESAICNIEAKYPEKTLCIVSHGIVISLYATQYYKEEPYEIWQHLSIPACVVLSRNNNEIIEIIK